jgi:hypothetical protein
MNLGGTEKQYWTVANIDPERLRKIARNTLKCVDACLREVDGHFQHLL